MCCCWPVAAVFAGRWLLNRPVEQVVINGEFERVSADRLESLLRPYMGQGFLATPLDVVQQQLAAVPWVATARVSRKWPGTLDVTVTEEQPAARWGEHGLLNPQGRLFVRQADHIPAGLPRLNGPEGTEAEVAARYVAIQEQLVHRGLALAALELDERGAWSLAPEQRHRGTARFAGCRYPAGALFRGAGHSRRCRCRRRELRRHALHERFCRGLEAASMPPGSKRPMPRKDDKHIIVGLDIGTSKVVAIVGELQDDGQIEVIGFGMHPSKGLKKGVVVNIESTVTSIQRAVEEAELMAGCDISQVYAGIAGSHVRSLNSHGIVAIRDREVTQSDVDRVIDAARAVAIPADQKILHVLPQEFIIDGQEGIREPIGMSGVRLEARVHMVTGAASAAQNIVKCVQRCGLEVEDIVLEQLASSYAVLTDDEKELGICLVDIGGGTTDIAVFNNGAIRHTAVIPIAGDQVTNDIAISMRTPTQYAEEIKIKYACALSQLANLDETIEVPSVGDRPPRRLARQTLAEVVEPRYEELFGLIRDELRRSGFENMIAAGIVLTGGSAKMEGAVELAEEVFHMPVRLGVPQHVRGLGDVVRNPIHSTGVGLLVYARSQAMRAGRGCAGRGRVA